MDMAVRGRLFYFNNITYMVQRVTFYIDGFNFYYGLRRTKRNEPQWGDYYWIDMVKLCQGFLGVPGIPWRRTGSGEGHLFHGLAPQPRKE